MIIYNPPFGLTKVTKEQAASITNHRKRNGIFQQKNTCKIFANFSLRKMFTCTCMQGDVRETNIKQHLILDTH